MSDTQPERGVYALPDIPVGDTMPDQCQHCSQFVLVRNNGVGYCAATTTVTRADAAVCPEFTDSFQEFCQC